MTHGRELRILTVIPRVVTQPHYVGSGEFSLLGVARPDADQGAPQAEGGRSGRP
jgi:hypothetical protein